MTYSRSLLHKTVWLASLALVASMLVTAGCNKKSGSGSGSGSGSTTDNSKPSFTLAWSEYPSWSVFWVAHDKGLIDKDKGKLGSVEKKWGVDIVLIEADYDTCLDMYNSKTTDAVCITNMDSLAPAMGHDSVAILPTSTSDGADACIVAGVSDVAALKGTPTFGLEKSVSQYAFERILEKKGLDPKEYPFKNMDPQAASTAMQNKDATVKSIMVWNPFVLITTQNRKDAKVLFSSAEIKEEIIDMVVVDKAALAKEGGESFACAVIDAFYQVSDMIEGEATRDETLVKLGSKFGNLGVEEMKKIVTQTKFYKSPDAAITLFENPEFKDTTMPTVVKFCADQGIIDKTPKIGFGDGSAQLNFDLSYVRKVKDGKNEPAKK